MIIPTCDLYVPGGRRGVGQAPQPRDARAGPLRPGVAPKAKISGTFPCILVPS